MSLFRTALIDAMSLLATDRRVIFVGQSIRYPGHIMYSTLEHIPESRRLEVPVFEDTQMGLCTGMALSGEILPVCIFPRMDFLVLAMNQLVNHLDKIPEMNSDFKPKVLIRTMVGSIHPMHPGCQHCQDYIATLKLMLTNIEVVRLEQAEQIMPAYQRALAWERSTILVEAPLLREGYEDG